MEVAADVVVRWLISNYHRTEQWAVRLSSWVVRSQLSDIPPRLPPVAGGRDSRVWKCNSYNYCYGKIWWWFWRSLLPSHVGWKLIFHPIIYRNILLIFNLEMIIMEMSHVLHSPLFPGLVVLVMILMRNLSSNGSSGLKTSFLSIDIQRGSIMWQSSHNIHLFPVLNTASQPRTGTIPVME